MGFLKGRVDGGTAQAPAPAPRARRIDNGTEQQLALWGGLVRGDRHVLAEARAGCGKSSSCREGMWRMLERDSRQRIGYAVYNKANADEFRDQCPPGCDVATSHSFGFQALKRAIRSNVEKNKSYLILDETREGRTLPRWMRKSIAVLAGHGKNAALDPRCEGEQWYALKDELFRLALYYDVRLYGRPDTVVSWAADVLRRSAQWTDVVDFDDMIWLPPLLEVEFPPFDTLFMDEVQDWNVAQHKLIPLMCRAGRVVAVGDRHQSINAFRGADVDSIPNLSAMLAGTPRGLESYPLTVTFRCPKSHVALANQYVKDLAAHPSAPEGEVGHTDLEALTGAVGPGDLVICPTNAPVISACLQMIAQKRPAYVRGRAVGEQLTGVLRGIPDARTVADQAKGVETWRARELTRLSGLDGVEDVVESVCDRAMGLQAILSACDSPADAPVLIERLFSDERKSRAGTTTFSTVHRAKGDEAATVYFITAPGRAPKKEWEGRQRANLQYVALTRSKSKLVFVKPPDAPGAVSEAARA